MEVILLERIEKLGQMGDVVNVKPGYARNFLLPMKKALRATKASLELFERQRVELEALNLKRREEAQAVADKMTGLKIIIVRQAGETGQLYGSVSGRDLADAIKAEGFIIARSQVNLDSPIKTLGVYDVRISLHPEVAVNVTVVVARSLEEANRASTVAEVAMAVDEEIVEVIEAEVAVEE